MPFLKRLGFYLIGLSVGLVFLAVFLKKKSEETGTRFCYFPNCRVLKELRSKPLQYSGEVKVMMGNGLLDSVAIAYFLNEGDVDFGISEPNAEPCNMYFIQGRYQQRDYQLEVHNCTDNVVLEQFQMPSND